MRWILTIILFSIYHVGYSQKEIEPSGLQKISYKPKVHVNGINQFQTIKFDTLLKYGLQVVLDDKSYKVVQFDIMYDCHSKSLIDFSIKRYFGDKVLPTDTYLQKRIIAGDIIDVFNTVIVKGTERYVMKEATLIIEK